MPGKARRVASRQAQLGRRRKRLQKGPGDVHPAQPRPPEVDGTRAEVVAVPDAETPVPAPESPSPVAARPAAAVPSPAPSRAPSRARVRGERPATHNYIKAELRRILSMAGVVLAVIIVLGILL